MLLLFKQLSRRYLLCIRYKDVLKRHLNVCAIDPARWEELAAKRLSWRSTIFESTKSFEDNSLATLDVKRQLRKERPKPSYMYMYSTAGQLYDYECERVRLIAEVADIEIDVEDYIYCVLQYTV